MRHFGLACLVAIAVFTGTRSASAYILTYDDFHDIKEACPSANVKQADVIIGEAFAFVQSAIMNGSADLLTLHGTFVLSRPTISEDGNATLIAFTNCVRDKTSDVLTRAGVRLIKDISDRDAEFRARSFAFFSTFAGSSISAYQLVRVRADRKTHLQIHDVTCGNLQFAIPYVAYPLDSLQPGLEPSRDVLQPLIDGKLDLTLTMESPEVRLAIQESFAAIDDMIWLSTDEKPTYRQKLQTFMDGHKDELWLWVNLTSKDKSCSAQMSVKEE